MLRVVIAVSTTLFVCLGMGCNRQLPASAEAATPSAETSAPDGEKAEIRITGMIQAVHSIKVVVPQIQGQFGNMTLTGLIPNGSRVQEGDLIATFDPASQFDAAREAQGKYEDLSHQVEQKQAENRANSEKRMVELRQAEGDLTKAELELEKGPVLSEIDRLQSEARVEGARTKVAGLKQSMAFRDKAEIAALRGLELQRDRQKIAIQRVQANLKKLEIHAPLAGMVVHELLPRSGTLGRPQEGDQLFRGYPLVSIFDPSQMQVRCSINEPDITPLLANARVTVTLDAYPDLVLPAHFLTASPVASSGMGTPIKTFIATFGLDKADPHLMPDLSAAVLLTVPAAAVLPGASK